MLVELCGVSAALSATPPLLTFADRYDNTGCLSAAPGNTIAGRISTTTEFQTDLWSSLPVSGSWGWSERAVHTTARSPPIAATPNLTGPDHPQES